VSYVSLSLTVLALLIWTILTFFRGAFWQLRAIDAEADQGKLLEEWPRVAVIVPARNEAETIERCVESLAAQDYPGKFQIVVVDDHSDDGTSGLARNAAERGARLDRVTVMHGAELQQGWTGKLWALQQGYEASLAEDPEFLWFTDADVVHAPDTLRLLVARAESQRLDLASLMVLLQAKSLPEKLLIPAFLYFFLMLYPPNWIVDRKAKTAGAAGGCILLRKAALERMGGISAIRGEVIDDCALAREVKRGGGSIWMGLTRKSVSLREYSNFGQIRDLIARTAFTQLKYSPVVLFGTILGMLVMYLVPVAFSFQSDPLVWRLSLVTWALMTVTYLPTVRFYGLSPLWAPLLPLAALFYSYATWLSAARYWMGRGGQWKGRAQARAKRSA